VVEAIGAVGAIGVLEAIAGNDPLPSGLKAGIASDPKGSLLFQAARLFPVP
jgi:hypothetical protein